MNLLKSFLILTSLWFVAEANYAVVYGPWSKWSECSKPCGGGEMTRSRKCLRTKRCDLGLLVEKKSCNKESCRAVSFQYRVTTVTADDQSEMDTMHVTLTINPDSSGKNTATFELTNTDESNFGPGETDNFVISSLFDFREIKSVKIAITFDDDDEACAWNVRKVIIASLDGSYRVSFEYDGSVEPGFPVILTPTPTSQYDKIEPPHEYDDQYVPDVPPKHKPSIRYQITTWTSNDQPVLPTGDVILTINPEHIEGGVTVTFKLINRDDANFRKGEIDIFFYESEVDLGKIGSIRLEYKTTPNNDKALWKMEKIVIVNNGTGYRVTFIFNGSIGSSVSKRDVILRLLQTPTKSPSAYRPTKEPYKAPEPAHPPVEYPTAQESYPAPIEPEIDYPATPRQYSKKILPSKQDTYGAKDPQEYDHYKPEPAYPSNDDIPLPDKYPHDSETYGDNEIEEYRPLLEDVKSPAAHYEDYEETVEPLQEEYPPTGRYEYRVTTMTSASSTQSAGGDVYIIINPRTSSPSSKIHLSNGATSNFRPGQRDEFEFSLEINYEHIESVEVEFESKSSKNAEWKPSEIIVVNVAMEVTVRFRYNGVVGHSRNKKSVILYPSLDGQWCQWSPFSRPLVTCLRAGQSQPLLTRQRKCNCPAPTNHGLPCVGLDKENKPASLPACHVGNKWKGRK